MTRILAALCLLVTACAPPPVEWYPQEDFDPADLEAPHGNPHFFNPWDPQELHGMRVAFRWVVSRNEEERGATPAIPFRVNRGERLSGSAATPEITWVGHSTFAIHDGSSVVLTDPHFGPRASVVSRETPPGLPLEAIPPDAFAVISHNHYDHLDAFTVDALPRSVTWFVPLGLKAWFEDRDRVAVELDWWESADYDGWTLTCLPSQHWSRRFGQGMNETLWCAWLLESPTHRYFFAGDTGYFGGFAEYGRRFPGIDVALLPIGAYAPRWLMGYQHVTPAEAYRAFLDLRARSFLAMHWGTFDLTHEALDAPPQKLADALPEGEKRVHILALGETWPVP